MTINLTHITVAYIGRIPDGIFKQLKAEGVPGVDFKDAAAEHAAFEKNLTAVCAAPDPKKPLVVPPWRLFAPYGDGYFLHPYASETAFPATGIAFIRARQAALECCDVRVELNGLITAVAIGTNPIVVIHNDGTNMTLQPVCADEELRGMCFTSAGAQSPLSIHVHKIEPQTALIQTARRGAGDNVKALLQRPPYFPQVS